MIIPCSGVSGCECMATGQGCSAGPVQCQVQDFSGVCGLRRPWSPSLGQACGGWCVVAAAGVTAWHVSKDQVSGCSSWTILPPHSVLQTVDPGAEQVEWVIIWWWHSHSSLSHHYCHSESFLVSPTFYCILLQLFLVLQKSLWSFSMLKPVTETFHLQSFRKDNLLRLLFMWWSFLSTSS